MAACKVDLSTIGNHDIIVHQRRSVRWKGGGRNPAYSIRERS